MSNENNVNHRQELVSLCTKYYLSDHVKSTCIKIYNKIHTKLPVDNLLQTILVVAAKCNDIHELPFRKIEGESEVHEALNFEYDFPSSYSIMAGMLIKLQCVQGKDVGKYSWKSVIKKMDELLIKDDNDYTDEEKACVACNLSDEIVKTICDLERVNECRKLLNI